ncbi:UNVERIFIED_CONTAM: fructose permease, partial [Lactobacillus acidophilus]|nr:fructose permease [Lactobacillus acidophilus]
MNNFTNEKENKIMESNAASATSKPVQ